MSHSQHGYFTDLCTSSIIKITLIKSQGGDEQMDNLKE